MEKKDFYVVYCLPKFRNAKRLYFCGFNDRDNRIYSNDINKARKFDKYFSASVYRDRDEVEKYSVLQEHDLDKIYLAAKENRKLFVKDRDRFISLLKQKGFEQHEVNLACIYLLSHKKTKKNI